MNRQQFPNPKLNLPQELRDSLDNNIIKNFQAAECYLGLVGKYIYTNINLDYRSTDQNHIHAWIQKVISANVLRSLYLRNAFVEEMNARNYIGLFLPLKAWFDNYFYKIRAIASKNSHSHCGGDIFCFCLKSFK